MAERRVLIVEPNGALAARLRGVLERCGLAGDVLGDGQAALERVGDPMPDLVLLDVEPTVGDTICKQVKKKRKATPVIVVSEKEERTGRLRSRFGAHPDAVLRKPVAFEELMKQMDSLLGLGGMMTAASASEEVDEILLDDTALEPVAEDVTPVSEPVPVGAARSTFTLGVPPPRPEPESPEEREWRKKRELATLREALQKRGDGGGAQKAELVERAQKAEAERDRARQEIADLRRRASLEKTDLERELTELRKKVADRDQQILAHDAVTARLEKWAQELAQERDRLLAHPQSAEAAEVHARELAHVRQELVEREQELAALKQTSQAEVQDWALGLAEERDQLAVELAELRGALAEK